MKRVLAVIPARAGSKGIPNKNIRLINGKPMIAYCIENAINSSMIDEIIISSDSDEVRTIANHYGVEYRNRRPELCDDKTTLDDVVYDAIDGIEADYVVTMQPTSPTLTYSTLDDAINYAIENELDTLISVVNRPHLSWKEENGIPVPAYLERLNRQYLPKNYLETGAFVISKRSIITKHSRIGKRVQVYEIPENEAIDVDSFIDLKSAEMILTEKKVAIVTAGNKSIGLGHVYRTMELADTFYVKPDFYYNTDSTSPEVFGRTSYRLIGYRTIENLINYLESGDYNLVINDILDTDEEYILSLKNLTSQPQIVNFEDVGTGSICADLTINALYNHQGLSDHIYSGYKYYIVPKLFTLYDPIQIHERVKNVFVCFGGADPQGYTEKTLSLIVENYTGITFHIVLGRAKENVKELLEYQSDRIVIYSDIRNIPELMGECDLAITSRGRTCFELAYLGIPTLALAQNERETAHDFASEPNGFLYLGKDVSIERMKNGFDLFFSLSFEDRKEMQTKMLMNDLRHGRDRVKSLIDSL